MIKWREAEIGDLTGRVSIVTGANSGLGLYTTRVLARQGSTVVMACRNQKAAAAARDEVLAETPGAVVDVMALDLGSLESVRAFAEAFLARYDRLDVLFNNAGLMAIPPRKTSDGFEMQFGVNHLGHFALTGRLLDRLLATPHSRVVTLSSSAAYTGWLNFDDLQSEKRYGRYAVYSQAKLANLMFALELQRRLAAAGATTTSYAAQPGFVLTNLQARAVTESNAGFEQWLYEGVVARMLAQPVEVGTQPQLYAGLAKDAVPGEFYQPRWIAAGKMAAVKGPRRAYDAAALKRLWQVSEELTGVRYAALAGVAKPVAG